MADERHVRGLAALQAFLDTVAPRVEANIMRSALRAGLNVVKPVAQANIHSVSGELAKGLKIGTRKRGHTVTASLKEKGKHSHIARFVEYGTKAHTIAAKDGSLHFSGTFAKSVQHPGARPRAFLRPALDRQTTAAVVAVGNYIKTRLQDKHGLDTSHITVEGDE